MISRTAGYALQAVLYLAEHGEAGPIQVTRMAEALSLPRNYLSKTLHLMTRGRILTSVRGKFGGFNLAVTPSRLALWSVVKLFDDLEARRCLLGRRECSDRSACSAHGRWKDVAARYVAFLRETTVADLLASGELPA